MGFFVVLIHLLFRFLFLVKLTYRTTHHTIGRIPFYNLLWATIMQSSNLYSNNYYLFIISSWARLIMLAEFCLRFSMTYRGFRFRSSISFLCKASTLFLILSLKIRINKVGSVSFKICQFGHL